MAGLMAQLVAFARHGAFSMSMRRRSAEGKTGRGCRALSIPPIRRSCRR